MRNNWSFPVDHDEWSPYMLKGEQFVHPHFLSHISSFVENSLYNSRVFCISGSLALQDAFNCMSKFAGALLLWLASGSNSDINHKSPGNSIGSNTKGCKSCIKVNRITITRHNLAGFCSSFKSKGESFFPMIFNKILSLSVRQLCQQAEQLQSIPMLSIVAALTPPLGNASQNAVAVPLENDDVLMQRCMDQSPCEVEHRGCGDLSSFYFNCTRHAVEPVTGIEFPTILDCILGGDTKSNWMPEILVGTGSRTTKIIKLKSLKVYAFGFYVHPYDVCEKLSPKYASIPASEVTRHHKFYEDLLREDINMTVRLVVSVNGIKIATVKNAFEKSLRARLMKTNPDTDYDCLQRFGSLFSQDIPIHAGTTIYFRRTADGRLVTEIGGNQIGVVHSKDLCRAFFGMYIGDVPVCEETKKEIGRNVATIIGRC